MGKLQRRLTITPYATLLGWRRLQMNSTSSYEFSGQLIKHAHPELHEYLPYIKFDFLHFYTELRGHWDEHFLGELDGKFYTLFTAHQSKVRT